MHNMFYVGQSSKVVVFHLSWLLKRPLVKRPETTFCLKYAKLLTWAALDTRGSKVVLSMWVRYQLVQVGVVAHEARAGILTHPIVLEVPTSLQHKQRSFSTLGPKKGQTLKITLHSSITALAWFSEGEQTALILEALPNERFNQQFYVSLVLKATIKQMLCEWRLCLAEDFSSRLYAVWNIQFMLVFTFVSSPDARSYH